MNKSLITVLDDVILPASLTIVAKFIGVILVIALFDVEWSVNEYTNDLFAFGSTRSREDIEIITSYSDLFMYFTLALLFSLNVFKVVFMKTKKIDSNGVKKLIERNVFDLLRGSYEIYRFATIWLWFTILANILIIVNVAQGNTYTWIGIVTSITTLLLAFILLQDVYQEIRSIKKSPAKYLDK